MPPADLSNGRPSTPITDPVCMQFYIGELVPEDRAEVPLGGGEAPSEDFLRQLRAYSSFRMTLQQASEVALRGGSVTACASPVRGVLWNSVLSSE